VKKSAPVRSNDATPLDDSEATWPPNAPAPPPIHRWAGKDCPRNFLAGTIEVDNRWSITKNDLPRPTPACRPR
jgi:hypothetical protein